MLSNVILSTYLQHADHTDRAMYITHWSKRPEKRRKEKKRRKEEEEKKRAVPRAAAAYGRQLKIPP